MLQIVHKAPFNELYIKCDADNWFCCAMTTLKTIWNELIYKIQQMLNTASQGLTIWSLKPCSATSLSFFINMTQPLAIILTWYSTGTTILDCAIDFFSKLVFYVQITSKRPNSLATGSLILLINLKFIS